MTGDKWQVTSKGHDNRRWDGCCCPLVTCACKPLKHVTRHALLVTALSAVLIWGAFCPDRLRAEQWRQLRGVIHVQTCFDGAGSLCLPELVGLARQKGLEVIVTADHDLQAMEYGLFPLRNLIKRRETRPSVLSIGPEKFLDQIAQANQSQTDVLVIPGVQSSPFYYWSGTPWDNNLTAHDFHKELLLVGMTRPEDYEGLPLLHRGFATDHIAARLPRWLVFWAALALALALMRHKGIWTYPTAILAVASLVLIIEGHPFHSSAFDPYHGDRGTVPHQAVIDHVNRAGGLAFWLHPESAFAVQGVKLGPVRLQTDRHPQDLIATDHYTGFEAVYGDTTTAELPGRHWDEALGRYCRGQRDRPVWAIAGADFHGRPGEDPIDTYQTAFWAKDKTLSAILEAMANGRMAAVLKGSAGTLRIDRFAVGNGQDGASATMGGQLVCRAAPRVEGRIAMVEARQAAVTATLIRDGKVVATFSGSTPLAFAWTDPEPVRVKGYYRLVVEGPQAGRVVANPVFLLPRS